MTAAKRALTPKGDTVDRAGRTYLCPSGHFSAAGGKCEPCLPGTFSEAGSSKCSLCAKGSFSDSMGQASCTPCPSGLLIPKKGARCQSLSKMSIWFCLRKRAIRCPEAMCRWKILTSWYNIMQSVPDIFFSELSSEFLQSKNEFLHSNKFSELCLFWSHWYHVRPYQESFQTYYTQRQR